MPSKMLASLTTALHKLVPNPCRIYTPADKEISIEENKNRPAELAKPEPEPPPENIPYEITDVDPKSTNEQPQISNHKPVTVKS